MKFLMLLLVAAAAGVSSFTLEQLLQHGGGDAQYFGALSARAEVGRQPSSGSLPVVDLGYVRQQATSFNTIGNQSYYVFKNIRFAAPPLGDLRFRKPAAPLHESEVRNGSYPAVSTACAQPAAVPDVATGGEDCLFLDVYMPTGINCTQLLPVLAVWFGGGYVAGTKERAGDPTALWKAGAGPFVFVAANYRLGSFGWLAPPEEGDVTPNVGLHDTRMAMDWIGGHISKFGGDTGRVTAMGQSAGGGVVLHNIVANSPTLPFQQAILQSPGWRPEVAREGRAPVYEAFLKNAGCSHVACLRNSTTDVLIAANLRTIGQWNSGALGTTSGFYPVPDGDFIPDTPANLLSQGRFHREVQHIIASSARWEASGDFGVPANLTDAAFVASLTQYTSNVTLITKLAAAYGPDDTSLSGYNRARDLIGDVGFNCNALWTATAFSIPGHKLHRVIFNVGTAAHGSDRAYTWSTGGTVTTLAFPQLVVSQQEWVAEFVVAGNMRWPEWRVNGGTALWLNETGPAVGQDYLGWRKHVQRCTLLRDEIYEKGSSV